jgi:hypothetical protein
MYLLPGLKKKVGCLSFEGEMRSSFFILSGRVKTRLHTKNKVLNVVVVVLYKLNFTNYIGLGLGLV